MTFNVKKVAGGNGGNRVEQAIIEAGVYPARLVQLIDLGLQPQRPFKGQDKPPMQEIMLTYELSDVFMVDEDGNELEDKPRWVSETIPFHNLVAEKAKSTQRYNAFDPKGDYEGDLSKALESPINVTLVNNVVGDKTYTNVAGLATMRQRDIDKCPELKNPSKLFSLDDPDMKVFEALPEWIQNKIKENLNFAGSKLEALLGKPAKAAKAPKAAPKEAPKQEEDDGDDNPY
jgi:hypothetical protein